jgi:phenol 2-monooxygenase
MADLFYEDETYKDLDVSLVAGIDDNGLIGRFFDEFAVLRPRSDQVDLGDAVHKGLRI